MPETIHCSKCGQPIRVDGFADQMEKLRRHYKRKHPTAWKRSVKRGVEKRRKRK